MPRLAQGTVRDVYAHPVREDRLIKTFRTRKREAFEQRRGLIARLRRNLTLGISIGIMREYRAYLRTAHWADRSGRKVPLALVGEVVLTDQGLGQVVERITDGQGGLARRLRDFIGTPGGLDDIQLDALNDFVSDIYALGVNVPDISSDNIVWDGLMKRFVMIDGFGDKTFIPIREWLPVLNRRRTDARLARIGRSPALCWEPARRRFSLRPDSTGISASST